MVMVEKSNFESNISRLQAIASIASSIAIPVVIAIIGYFVQATVASGGLKKDYVQIATNILKDPPNEQNKELRQWAVQTLDLYSEVPFTKSTAESLANQKPIYVSRISVSSFPAPCMEPPKPTKLTEIIRKNTDGRILSEKDLQQFLLDLIDEAERSSTNAAALKCLQDSIRAFSEIYETGGSANKAMHPTSG